MTNSMGYWYCTKCKKDTNHTMDKAHSGQLQCIPCEVKLKKKLAKKSNKV
jgi:hypothetical protein